MHRWFLPTSFVALGAAALAFQSTAAAEPPSIKKQEPAAKKQEPPSRGSGAAGLGIKAVRRKALPGRAALWTEGAIEYEVDLVNMGPPVSTTLVLDHEGETPVSVPVEAATGTTKVGISDPAGLSHCQKAYVLLRLGSTSAPANRIEIESKCTFQQRMTPGDPMAVHQAEGKLTYRNATVTREASCGVGLKVQALFFNNSPQPVDAQVALVDPKNRAVFEDLHLPPRAPMNESISSQFLGTPGRYTIRMRDKAGAMPFHDPGFAVDVSRSCYPEVTSVRPL